MFLDFIPAPTETEIDRGAKALGRNGWPAALRDCRIHEALVGSQLPIA
jgi:hypothetical protein